MPRSGSLNRRPDNPLVDGPINTEAQASLRPLAREPGLRGSLVGHESPRASPRHRRDGAAPAAGRVAPVRGGQDAAAAAAANNSIGSRGAVVPRGQVRDRLVVRPEGAVQAEGQHGQRELGRRRGRGDRGGGERRGDARARAQRQRLPVLVGAHAVPASQHFSQGIRGFC